MTRSASVAPHRRILEISGVLLTLLLAYFFVTSRSAWSFPPDCCRTRDRRIAP